MIEGPALFFTSILLASVGYLPQCVAQVDGGACCQYYSDYVQLAQRSGSTAAFSDSLYSLAFARYPDGTEKDHHHAGRCATLIGNYSKALHYYTCSVTERPWYFPELERDSLVLMTLTRLEQSAQIDLWRARYKRFLNGMDSVLIRELDQRARSDQSLRSAMAGLNERFHNEHPLVRQLWRTIHLSDSINTLYIDSLISASGYPGVDRVGPDGSKNMWLLIQHADSSSQLRLFPSMRASCGQGYTPMKYCAYVSDRIMCAQPPHETVYGCDMKVFPDGVARMLPKDPQCVNLFREKVGLAPFHEFDHRGRCQQDKP